MGKETKISWTNSTYNPWRGCIKISAGCKNCYMFPNQEHYGFNPHEIVRTGKPVFTSPLRWLEPAKVFVCSWSDFFIEQADPWRAEVWEIIKRTPHLTYQILTKRPERILEHLPSDWGEGWPNVWMGVTIEDTANMGRAAILADIPAKLRFISYEPALEYVDFAPIFKTGKFQWLVSGGETGKEARPAEEAWFLKTRDVCQAFDVAYFHKQNGGHIAIEGVYGGLRIGGQIYQAFPV